MDCLDNMFNPMKIRHFSTQGVTGAWTASVFYGFVCSVYGLTSFISWLLLWFDGFNFWRVTNAIL
jgi:hypothetical protein